jgi:hypothetical protein
MLHNAAFFWNSSNRSANGQILGSRVPVAWTQILKLRAGPKRTVRIHQRISYGFRRGSLPSRALNKMSREGLTEPGSGDTNAAAGLRLWRPDRPPG